MIMPSTLIISESSTQSGRPVTMQPQAGSTSGQLLSLRGGRLSSSLPALSATPGPGGRVLSGVAVVVGQLCSRSNVFARIDAHAVIPINHEDLGIAVGISAAPYT